MGLLDTMDDPQFRLGMGLLAAGSARSDGAGFGQRLNEVLGGMDAWAQQKQKQKFLDMQMKNYESEIAQRQAALEKQNRGSELLSRLLGGSPSTALEQGAAVGDFGPTKTNAARMNSGGGLANATPEQLAALKVAGYDLTDVYKLTRPTLTNVNGTMVDTTNPQNAERYIADPTKGFSFSGGKVGVLPGFMDAQSAIVGGQAQATEGAKAALDLVAVQDGTGGSVQMTRADAARKLSQPQISNVGTREPSPQEMAIIQADIAKNGNPNPVINLQDTKPTIGRTLSKAEEAKQVGAVTNVVNAGDAVNTQWLKSSYEPVVTNGSSAQNIIEQSRIARNAMTGMGGTGWGTETKAAAANILAGLGVAPENAKLYASNTQVFQNSAMERLRTVMNEAKGTQTEGDATRAGATFAQLKNTTKANEFILDLIEAKAERDKAKATFYSNALPIAKQSGDLSEVDRQWQKRVPSIFDMPSMKKWSK